MSGCLKTVRSIRIRTAAVWGSLSLVAVLCVANVLLILCTDDPWPDVTLAVWTFGLTLATVALAAAAVVALRSIGESRRDRNAAAMTDLSQRWDNEHFRGVRHKIQHYSGTGPDSRIRLRERIIQLRNDNDESYRELLTEPSFLEDLQISLEYTGIDFNIVKDSLGYIIWDRWCLWQPAIEELRDLREERTVFEHFQTLAERIKRELPGLPDLHNWSGPKY